MSLVVVLDTGPLGFLSNPTGSTETEECTRWFLLLLSRGVVVALPEIADYEIRRELLRSGKTRSLARLDELKTLALYVPITTQAMLKAAELWAQVRNQGKPTADHKALDGDVILAAQASLVGSSKDTLITGVTRSRLDICSIGTFSRLEKGGRLTPVINSTRLLYSRSRGYFGGRIVPYSLPSSV